MRSGIERSHSKPMRISKINYAWAWKCQTNTQWKTSTQTYFIKEQVWYQNSIQFLSYPITYGNKCPHFLQEHVRTQYTYLSLEHHCLCGEMHILHSLKNVSGATPVIGAVSKCEQMVTEGPGSFINQASSYIHYEPNSSPFKFFCI